MGMGCTMADYDNLIGHIYQGAREDRPWSKFVDNLSTLLDARDASLYIYSKRDKNCNYFVTSDRAPHLLDLGYLNEVIKLTFSLEDEPASQPMTCKDYRRGLIFRQTPLYKKYLQPIDVIHMLYQDVYHDEDVVIRVALNRTRFQDDFDIPEKELLSSVTTHLRRALDLRNSYEESTALATQTLDLLSKMAIGTVVVDSDKNVLAVNQAATKVLTKNYGISMKEGRLHLNNNQPAQKLRQALDMMIVAHQRGLTMQKGVSLGLSSLDGLPGLDVVVKPLFLSNMPSAKSRPAALLLLNDCESGSIDVEAKMLRDAYNLTDREATLVVLLGQGYTLSESAKELGVSINTIKRHLKGTYEKLGKHRRSQVVAMLSRCTAKFI